jgi:hypothetical protein
MIIISIEYYLIVTQWHWAKRELWSCILLCTAAISLVFMIQYSFKRCTFQSTISTFVGFSINFNKVDWKPYKYWNITILSTKWTFKEILKYQCSLEAVILNTTSYIFLLLKLIENPTNVEMVLWKVQRLNEYCIIKTSDIAAVHSNMQLHSSRFAQCHCVTTLIF